MLDGCLDWPHAAHVGRLEKPVKVGNRTTVETQRLVTSVPRSKADATPSRSRPGGETAETSRIGSTT
jgi:hypothetical protein